MTAVDANLRAELLAVIPHLAGQTVLVAGDVFLDEYLLGRAERLSREAPIPVLEFVERRCLPGGAGNPAVNIAALGSQAILLAVVGTDEPANTLRAELARLGLSDQALLVDPDRPTTTKTRIIAQGSLRFPQQLARLDRVDRRPLAPHIESAVVDRLARFAAEAKAILLSDYRSGLLTPAVVAAARVAAQQHGRFLSVDSQGDLDKYRGFDLVKCNHEEAARYLDRPLRSEADYRAACAEIRQRLDLGVMLITRGPDGLSLDAAGQYSHLPAPNRSQVFDVTGAGDTVIAVATLALAAGASPVAAAALANTAAGLVIRKLGVATTTREELAWAVETWGVMRD